MMCHRCTYRGYTIDLEQKDSIWFVAVSPKTPDLPILPCYCMTAITNCEADAIAEAKSKVDKALLP